MELKIVSEVIMKLTAIKSCLTKNELIFHALDVKYREKKTERIQRCVWGWLRATISETTCDRMSTSPDAHFTNMDGL